MKEVHSRFDYRISCDEVTNKITAVAWMMSVMRAPLPKFGRFIALDAMKHELKKLNWNLLMTAMKIEDGGGMCSMKSNYCFLMSWLVRLHSQFNV